MKVTGNESYLKSGKSYRIIFSFVDMAHSLIIQRNAVQNRKHIAQSFPTGMLGQKTFSLWLTLHMATQVDLVM